MGAYGSPDLYPKTYRCPKCGLEFSRVNAVCPQCGTSAENRTLSRKRNFSVLRFLGYCCLVGVIVYIVYNFPTEALEQNNTLSEQNNSTLSKQEKTLKNLIENTGKSTETATKWNDTYIRDCIDQRINGDYWFMSSNEDEYDTLREYANSFYYGCGYEYPYNKRTLIVQFEHDKLICVNGGINKVEIAEIDITTGHSTHLDENIRITYGYYCGDNKIKQVTPEKKIEYVGTNGDSFTTFDVDSIEVDGMKASGQIPIAIIISENGKQGIGFAVYVNINDTLRELKDLLN